MSKQFQHIDDEFIKYSVKMLRYYKILFSTVDIAYIKPSSITNIGIHFSDEGGKIFYILKDKEMKSYTDDCMR